MSKEAKGKVNGVIASSLVLEWIFKWLKRLCFFFSRICTRSIYKYMHVSMSYDIPSSDTLPPEGALG